MKKILSIVVILGISAFSICGCNKEASKSENQSTIEVAPVAEDYTTYLEQELIRIKAESAN